MNRTCLLAGVVSLLTGLVSPVSGESLTPSLRRLALVAGANVATPDRPRLRFAQLDAERFAGVMSRMGGVAGADSLLLREPTRRALLDALAVLHGRVLEARATAERTEVVFYFSGHADDNGLLLGRERVSYSELRQVLGSLPSDVRIAVLDACASGAITRLKGGQLTPAFLSDVSSQVRGHAFLTSSSESEAAQESDQLQGSYFTHALLSGLRGAADASGDGKVTLNEAYQFAFQETLSDTASTEGGAQHPAYDIKMAGTGDVVLTDLRETRAAIVLGPDFDGRFFVRDAAGNLVAELRKPAGRSVELGVDPGRYEIRYEQRNAFLKAKLEIADGERRALNRLELHPTRRFPTRLRGPARAQDHTLAGRSRLDLRLGTGRFTVSTQTVGGATTDRVTGGSFALGYAYWVRDDLSLDLSFVGQDIDVRVRSDWAGSEETIKGSYGGFLGARGYAPVPGSVRPFAEVGIGVLTDYVVVDTPSFSEVSQNDTDFAFRLGGGVEARLGGHASLALNLMTTRRGSDWSYGGGLGFGWTFGHRH